MSLLEKYEIGVPCMLNGIMAGRIVGEHEDGERGEINGVEMFSIPLFCTPHGTIVKTGYFYLSPITEEGMIRLKGYENELREAGKEAYAGKLLVIPTKDLNKSPLN